MGCNIKYLSESETSEITGRAIKTLRNDRLKKIGISYIKLGRSVRYSLDDIIKHMEKNRIITNN